MIVTEAAGVPPHAACKHVAGAFVPVIDRNACEGKGDCVTVCPVGVFAVARLPKQARIGISLKGRLKGYAHGWRQALLVAPGACEACGLCVAECPEAAITLRRA